MILYATQKQFRDRSGGVSNGLDPAYEDFFRELVGKESPLKFIRVPNKVKQARIDYATLRPGLVVLTGGNSCNPASFGSDATINDLAPERDEVEDFLIDACVQDRIPILGICRGFQFINIHFKGRLSYSIENHPPAKPHLCKCDNREYMINSFHNHGVKRQELSPQLNELAIASGTDIIEAYGSGMGGGILGVQWHPEREGTEPTLFAQLFGRLIARGF